MFNEVFSNNKPTTKVLSLFKEFNQPFYLFDLDLLDQRAAWIRKNIPKQISLFYSAKANPNFHIIRHIAKHFEGIEVASIGEIMAARLAGVSAHRLIFVGPMKTRNDIVAAVKIGVRHIVVESISQIHLIKEIGIGGVKLIVRVNPDIKIGSSSIKMGGKATQFGIDNSALNDVYQLLRQTPEVKLSGYHIYAGTQIEKVEVTLSIIEEMLDIYQKTPDDFRENIDFLDFGGGFSFPIDSSPHEYDIESLSLRINKAIEAFPAKVKLAFELGRFVVAPTGVFCTRVETLKYSKGKGFAICDGGINGFSGFATQSRFKQQNYPYMHIPSPYAGAVKISKFQGDIVGPLCTPTDLLAANVELSDISEGDILSFGNCGAYGLTHAMPLFLSHMPPLEIGISSDLDGHSILRKNTLVIDNLLAQGADPVKIEEILK